MRESERTLAVTEKLYDNDAYLAEFSATVLTCLPVDGGYDIVLDRTAFFPEGGGQYGDAGEIDGISVIDTQIREGVIYHRTQTPLPEGKTVDCRLDWAERFRRMQNHSGEHIVSGIVHSLFGYDNVGFHLSDGEMTMDYSGGMTEEDLCAVEAAANRAVWENREILCRYPSQEELRSLEYRSKKELNEPIRIVTVEGVDTCACCAPHVKRTGEIGGICIISSMRWKGGTRITVRCGLDAYHEYTTLRTDETALSRLFSAPQGKIFETADRLCREYADLRRAYNVLKKETVLLQVAQLPQTEGNLCAVFADGDTDVLRAAANEGVKKCTGVFVALSGDDETGYQYVICASAGLRAKAKEINGALSGRGGGQDTMIQGSFRSKERMIREYFKEFQI